MFSLFNKAKKGNTCFSIHTCIGLLTYFAAGFGAALLVEHYLKDTFAFPVWTGWVLLAAGVILHVYSCKKK